MDDYVIAKSINTESQRLRAGDPVSETDNFAPHSFNVLKARGFIVPRNPVSTGAADMRLFAGAKSSPASSSPAPATAAPAKPDAD